MGGFFKVYREIFQHEIFKYELDFRLFMLILGNAVYDKNGIVIEGIHVKRGQWLRSYRMLIKDLEYKKARGYSQYGIATIKRAISRLIKNGMVSVYETERGTLFTVLNYEKYQGFSVAEEDNAELHEERKRNESGTKAEQKEESKEGKKEKKDIKNNHRKRQKRIYDEDSPYMKMAIYFKEKILAWKPNARIPKDLNKWADDFRMTHEIDKRSKQEIKDVIDWATSDSFWQPNILSPGKLREKFDTLQGQMKRNNQSKWGDQNGNQLEIYGRGNREDSENPPGGIVINFGKYAGIGRISEG